MSVEATYALLLASVLESGCWRTGDDRIGEDSAAALLGWSTEHLANRRRDGTGPRAFRLGGAGHRVSYRLSDLAEWIEAQRAT
jgi:predicted DNA-binding transcriptional regulator AlpA